MKQSVSAGAAELEKETTVVFREQAQVLDLILQVGDTLYTHAKGEACIFLAVNAACLKHVGIHHAAAENLYPARTLAERASFATTEVA